MKTTKKSEKELMKKHGYSFLMYNSFKEDIPDIFKVIFVNDPLFTKYHINKLVDEENDIRSVSYDMAYRAALAGEVLATDSDKKTEKIFDEITTHIENEDFGKIEVLANSIKDVRRYAGVCSVITTALHEGFEY